MKILKIMIITIIIIILKHVNNNNIYIKVEPTLESLSQNENFALNNENVLKPTGFQTFMGLQQKDKSLIEIAKERPNYYSIKQFHGACKTYSLICRHGKIMIPKRIQKTLAEWYHNVQ